MPLYFFFLVLFAAWLSPVSAVAQTTPKRHTATTLVQIVKRAPAGLQWTPPAAIPVGVALGPAQLSATANTPGTFTYTPAAGTLLKPGDYLLSVVFTPSSPNFVSASASVPLTVEGPGNSTFVVNWPPTLDPVKPIYLGPDGLAAVMLSVVPIGDFQQPVSFACSGPSEITCIFNPVTVRPTIAPLQVDLTIKYTPPAAASLTRPGLSREQPVIPALAFAALALLILPGRRAISWRQRSGPARLGALLVSLALPAMAACGGGQAPGNVVVENLTESSIVESKTVQLTIVLPSSGSFIPSGPPAHPRVTRATLADAQK